MTSTVSMLLQQMELGAPQSHERLTVFPLKTNNGVGPRYLTLSQAINQRLLEITEVDESGSVPNLRVVNKSDGAVLLLDGEELVGAKQNRVLNTTILLREKSSTLIPVSCTEAGRWGYSSRTFGLSAAMMSPSVRYKKVRSVSKSVKAFGNYTSDQGEVWNEIGSMINKSGAKTSTSAMRDVFGSLDAPLDKYTDSLKLQEGQTGMLVLVGGKVVGFDHVSRPEAFAELYPRLLKSYAMDAILWDSEAKTEEPDPTPANSEVAAREFINAASQMEFTEHDSVGYGKDLRFGGDTVVGSTLTVDGTSVHTAFFRSDSVERPESPSEEDTFSDILERFHDLARESGDMSGREAASFTEAAREQKNEGFIRGVSRSLRGFLGMPRGKSTGDSGPAGEQHEEKSKRPDGTM